MRLTLPCMFDVWRPYERGAQVTVRKKQPSYAFPPLQEAHEWGQPTWFCSYHGL